jgi:catechol 2,3-dioxygenase-like lactoylglutathione lyase family enzyme
MWPEVQMTIAQSDEVVSAPKEFSPRDKCALKLKRWDHIALSVPDIVAAERWYVETLGAEVRERYGWGGDTTHPVPPHEDIYIGTQVLSLFQGESLRSAPPARMFHWAFHCDGMEELDTWHEWLTTQGISVRGPIAHPGFSAVSLYFSDPWGTRLEICTWLADWQTAKAETSKRPTGVVGRV